MDFDNESLAQHTPPHTNTPHFPHQVGTVHLWCGGMWHCNQCQTASVYCDPRPQSFRVRGSGVSRALKSELDSMRATEECVNVYLLLATVRSVMAGVDGDMNQSGSLMDQAGNCSERLGDSAHQLRVMVTQVVEQQVAGCHLVVATTSHHDPIVSHVLRCRCRRQVCGGVGSVVVELESLFSLNQRALEHLLQGLWGEATFSSRVLLLHIISNNNSLALRFLQAARLWQQPETRVVVVGSRTGVEGVLLHESVRNTLHIVYLSLHTRQEPTFTQRLLKTREEGSVEEVVEVHRRCMYCRRGEADVQLLHVWNLTSGAQLDPLLLHEEPVDYMGHLFTVMSMPYFPYAVVTRHETTQRALGLGQSLEAYMLNTIAAHLNFTYAIQEPEDGNWGVVLPDGNMTGIAGYLQRQQVDFSLLLSATTTRDQQMLFTRSYSYEELKAWSKVSAGRRHLRLTVAFFYSGGLLLEDPPNNPPSNMVARILIAWWLLFCMIITSAYRSSLIAHLTVQGWSLPIDHWEDLLKKDDWTWGTETSMFTSAASLYFTMNPDPVVRQIYDQYETESPDVGLQKVLAGKHSIVSWEYYITDIINSHYSDQHGQHPFYISKRGYLQGSGYAWSFRLGAPYYRPIRDLVHRLEEVGLVSQWLKEVMATRKRKGKGVVTNNDQSTDGQVVLGLHHLQGTFYLLFMGYGIALLILLGENLACCYSRRQNSGQ
ncbi:Glutamate receptor-like 39 [Homarus americanus]|uniref:Glutamate receptor-like 39 n=1 Tax=Homarus americanus TaxID=6706 RepID=A0A8J5NBD2_HOMAM|nr:Glutamate receptor-like 39 [Homarus americanus]